MGGLIRATNLWGYPELVRELGGDPVPLQERFHIPSGVEHVEDAFMSFDGFVRMLETTAEELGCADFGLRLSRWQGMDVLGPVAVIAKNAQSLLGGLEAIGRYLHVHSPALRLTFVPAGEDLVFSYEITEPGIREIPQGYELSMANGVAMMQLLGGPDARPRSISFMHRQKGSDTAYQQALGCEVLFDQPSCGLVLPASVAARTIDNADPETRRIATKYLEYRYLPSTASLTDRVAELARRLLPTGQCSAEVIADQLAMHPRTLQRHLAAEGIGCQDVVDRERREQAARYLAEPRLSLSQVAGLIGYSEQSTLNRSCQRWFGRTPRQYRSELARSMRP